jgi:hypothetical protein
MCANTHLGKCGKQYKGRREGPGYPSICIISPWLHRSIILIVSDSTTTSKQRPPWLLDLTATPEPSPWQAEHAARTAAVTTAAATSAATAATTLTSGGGGVRSSPTTTTTTGSPPSSPLVPGEGRGPPDPISDIKEAMFAQGDGGGGGRSVDFRLTTPENHHHQSAPAGWDLTGERPAAGGGEGVFSSGSGRGRQHCAPAHTRGGLFWDWTPAGVERTQACPGRDADAVGTAHWTCGQDGDWISEAPSLSDCRSMRLARLETTLLSSISSSQIPVLSLAANLTREIQSSVTAAAAATGGFFGGDILLVGRLLTNLIQQLLTSPGHLKSERTVKLPRDSSELLLQGLVELGSGLLDNGLAPAWTDLSPLARATTAANIMAALGDIAVLLGTATGGSTTAAAPHAAAVLHVFKDGGDGVNLSFVQSPPQVDWLGDAAPLIHIPASTVAMKNVRKEEENAVVFIIWDGLEHLLPTSTTAALVGRHILSSKILTIASALNRKSLPESLVTPVEVTWRHFLPPNRSILTPACLVWDRAADEWTTGGHVTQTNATHITCLFQRSGHLALFASAPDETLDDKRAERHDDDYAIIEDDKLADAGTLMGIIFAAIGGLCLALTIGCLIVHKRVASGSFVAAKPLVGGLNRLLGGGGAHLACFKSGRGGKKKEEDEGEDGFYPELNTSPTSTTLSSGTPTASTTVSNYFLSDCQVRQSGFSLSVRQTKFVCSITVCAS